jgi:hypothetical protein
MSVKLSSALPADDRNGMPAIATALVDYPNEVHVAVFLLRTRETRFNARTGDVVPIAEILACEAFTGATSDAETLHRLLRRQHERRTGKTELPLELEEAIDALKFDAADFAEGDDDDGDEPADADDPEPGPDGQDTERW